MSYSLEFVKSPLKEWRKLANPSVNSSSRSSQSACNSSTSRAPAAQSTHCYKIKRRSAGYRLVYQVDDKVVVITVIAVGKRELRTFTAGQESPLRTGLSLAA